MKFTVLCLISALFYINTYSQDFSLSNTNYELATTNSADTPFMKSVFKTDTPFIDLTPNPLRSDSNYIPPERFKTKLPQALIIPGILIAYGLTTIRDHGLYSSYQARKDLLKLTNGKGGPVDDILILSPYAEFGALLLFKVNCRNDFLNTTLLVVKSEALMFALVYSLKYITQEERPYSYAKSFEGVPLETRQQSSSAFRSMPSGHTAEAFVAATVVYREYRYKSPWYGIGAYTLATTVGVFRMINDQHWQSDVLVGAGIGMLSTNIVYATHQHRWGRNEVCLVPTFNKDGRGLLFSYRF